MKARALRCAARFFPLREEPDPDREPVNLTAGVPTLVSLR